MHSTLRTILVSLISMIAAPWAAAASADDAWHPLGSGTGANGIVWSALSANGNAYISGGFTSVDGVSANRVARWDGAAWHALGSGLDGDGDDIVTDGTMIFVVGKFANAGGNPAMNVAAWNGTAWAGLDAGVPNYPYAATIHNGSLYVGGGSPAWVRRWNGAFWDVIATGSGGWVYALCSYQGKLIIGGDYSDLASGASNDYLVQWDGSSFTPIGSGVQGVIGSLVVSPSGSDLYASGGFTTIGADPYNKIARWDGSDWHALGAGMNNGAGIMMFNHDVLYVGGDFTTAGGNPAERVAAWHDGAWYALGSGANNKVFAGCVTTQGLVFAGQFSSVGSSAAGAVAINYLTQSRFAFSQSFEIERSVTVLQPAIHTGSLVAHLGNGTPLTISIVTPPSHGVLTLTNAATGAFTYRANDDYLGSDSFTFQGSDGDGISNVAAVSITIVPNHHQSDSSHGHGCGFGSPFSGLVLVLLALGAGIVRRRR